MDKQFVTAGQGLLKVFFGACLSAAYVLLSTTGLQLGLIPLRLLSSGIVLVSLALTLIGLSTSAAVYPGYRSAMWCVAISGMASALTGILNGGVIYNILSMGSIVVSLLVVFLICKATASLLLEKGEEHRADRAAITWKVYVGCMLASLGCEAAADLIHNFVVSMALMGVFLALRLLAEGIYLVFLYKSQRVLQVRRQGTTQAEA